MDVWPHWKLKSIFLRNFQGNYVQLEESIQNFIFSINLKRYSHYIERTFLIVLVLLNIFLRLLQLGYSDFYGDETKVLYLRKDVSAVQFLLDQRKGPVQFVVAWVMEKFTGGYDEFWTRLPYSLAGIASVFVFYFVVRNIFGKRIAAIASLFFTFNGFFIAFSRTVQYQSFLILFGLLAVYLAQLYVKRQKSYLLVFSSVFLAGAFLSHWDAIFYLFVILLIFLNKKHFAKNIKDYLLFFVVPFLVVSALYYLPYFYQGYFGQNVSNYILRRIDGKEQLPNNSSFTFWLYNPSIIYYVPLVFIPFAFKKYRKGLSAELAMVFAWFFIPFLMFQFFFSNPGTHTQNYFLPLLILGSLGLVSFYDSFTNIDIKNILKSLFLFVLTLMFIVSSYAFVPAINTGYPWQGSSLDKHRNQYFIYGFPYNRGWREVRAYFQEKGWPRSFYTNDNVDIAEYYLNYSAVHIPYDTQMPEYYIYVVNSQEGDILPVEIAASYNVEKEILANGAVIAQIFRLPR